MEPSFIEVAALNGLRKTLDNLVEDSRVYLDTNLFIPNFLLNGRGLLCMEDIYKVLDIAGVYGERRKAVLAGVINYSDEYVSMILNLIKNDENIVLAEPIAKKVGDCHRFFRRRYGEWLSYSKAVGANGRNKYFIDRKGWRAQCANYSNIADVLNSSVGEERRVSIPPAAYSFLFDIIAPNRRYCRDKNGKDRVNEHLVCYGYLDVANSDKRVVILSDDWDIYALLKHSRHHVSRVLGKKALGLKSRCFKSLCYRETISFD